MVKEAMIKHFHSGILGYSKVAEVHQFTWMVWYLKWCSQKWMTTQWKI